MNQKEIAERLNLSRTTVSRCFTNHPKINPETRARVFELAADIGYDYSPPRNVAEGAARDRDTVAVLVGEPDNAQAREDTSREILAGISEWLAGKKLHLKVRYQDPAEFNLSPRARRIVSGMSNRDLMGFILMFPFKESSVGNLVTKFPTICALDDYEDLEVDCVDIDQTRGISRMVRHLHELGHRELGFVSWKYKIPTTWVERRFGAFVENLYRYNLPFREDRVVNVSRQGQLEVHEVVEAVRRMVGRGVTGIVCAADHQAYPLAAALRESGLRVPGDVSITGFDGIEPPSGQPRLTTVRMPFRDIGISSVVSLLRRVSHPSAPRRHILVCGRSIFGETTSRPEKK
jgi:LacI family transcriptional regulator